MDVQLIDRQPVRIAYLRHVGPYGEPLARFWRDEVLPWIAREGLTGRPMYGIGHDDPNVTDPDRCRADAGVEVPGDYVATGAAAVTVIPGGRYAVTRFVGDVTTIHAAWEAMMRTWLPASGFRLDDRPLFEFYGPDMRQDPATGRFECDITIPVASP